MDSNTPRLKEETDDLNKKSLKLRCDFKFKRDIQDPEKWIELRNSTIIHLTMITNIKQSHVYDSNTQSYVNSYNAMFTVQSIPNSLFYFTEVTEILVYFNSNFQNSFLYKLEKNTNNSFTLVPMDDYHIHESEFSATEVEVIVDIYYKHKTQLSFLKDMKNLVTNKEDFTIVSKDEQTFKVNKDIISVRCEVLYRMINSDMLEKKTGSINLKDWHSKTITELLNYIYTGSCDLSKSTHDLYRLSHYVQLTDLQEACSRYLELNLNEPDIVSTLKLTDEEEYGLDDLRKLSHEFVILHKETLINNQKFLKYLMECMSLRNITLALELSHEFQKKPLLLKALQFLKANYKEVIKIEECKEYLKSKPDLLLVIFQYFLALLP